MICWELPPYGLGFVTYKRNDKSGNVNRKVYTNGKFTGNILPDQIGTIKTIDLLMNLGKEWFKHHPNRPIQIGDISFPCGRDTPDHGTHQDGKTVDIRPIRKDDKCGDNYGLTYSSSAYDRELTKELIKQIVKLSPGARMLFNDSKIYNSSEYRGIVSYHAKHDDHLHIMFR